MSSYKKEEDIDTTKPYESEVVATAVPAAGNSNEPPIPAGHARFYCNKCHTVSNNVLYFASAVFASV